VSTTLSTNAGRLSQLDKQSQLKLKIACDYINAEVAKVRWRILTVGA